MFGLGWFFLGSQNTAHALYGFDVLVAQEGPTKSILQITPYVISGGGLQRVPVSAVIAYLPNINTDGACESYANVVSGSWSFNHDTDIKTLSIPLNDLNLSDGDKICVVAVRTGPLKSVTWHVHTVRYFTSLSVPELNPSQNSDNTNRSGIGAGSIARHVRDLNDYASFPSRANVTWIHNPTGFGYSSSSAPSSWGLETEPLSAQSGQIVLSDQACNRGWLRDQTDDDLPLIFDPDTASAPGNATYTGGLAPRNTAGICSPEVFLHLDVLPNQSLDIYVKDLCINGWDDSKGTRGKTIFEIYKVHKNIINTNPPKVDINGNKNSEKTIEIDHSEIRDGDGCYEYHKERREKIERRTIAHEPIEDITENINEVMLTPFDVDHNSLRPIANEYRKIIGYRGDSSGVVSEVKVNTHAVHVYEFITLPGIPEDYRYIIRAKIIGDTAGARGHNFNLFSLGVADNHGLGQNHGRITFDNNVNQLIGNVGSPLSILPATNSAYYSNYAPNPEAYYYNTTHRNGWSYAVAIAAPCTLDLNSITPAAVGLFDSDIKDDDPDNYLRIYEADRTGAPPDLDDSSAWRGPIGGVDDDGNIVSPTAYKFNGISNDPDDNSNVGTDRDVADNGLESFNFNFAKDKIYKVEFVDLHHRNWVQFVLPFGQDGVFEVCDGPPVVEINDQCDLELKSVSWQHPDTSEEPDFLNFDILHKKDSSDSGTFMEFSSDEWKVIRRIEADQNTVPETLITFNPGGKPGILDWFSLIENKGIHLNREIEVHLTGYINNSNGDLYHIATDFPTGYKSRRQASSSVKAILADGHNKFKLMKDDTGEYYFEVYEPDPIDPSKKIPRKIPEVGYCADINFEIEIGEDCAIYIKQLQWRRPNIPDPDLRVSLKRRIGTYVHSFKLSQLPAGSNKQLLTRYDKVDASDTHTLMDFVRANNLTIGDWHFLQITGYYDDKNKLTKFDIPGHTEDILAGRVAGVGSRGPPAILFRIDTSTGVPKIQYQTHDSQLNKLGNLMVQPTKLGFSCDYNRGVEVKFDQGCNLKVTQSNWAKTDKNTPAFLQLEVSTGDDTTWTANRMSRGGSAAWQTDRSKRIYDSKFWVKQDDPAILMYWFEEPSKGPHLYNLLNNGDVTPSSSTKWKIKVVGYYDNATPPNLVPYTDASFSPGMKRELVEGHAIFKIIQSPGGYHIETTEGGSTVKIPTGNNTVCSSTPEPKAVVEINNNCDIIITQLTWNGYSDDNDNDSSTAHALLDDSANNFRLQLYPKGTNIPAGASVSTIGSIWSAPPPNRTYIDRATISAVKGNGPQDLHTSTTYEIRLDGFVASDPGNTTKAFHNGSIKTVKLDNWDTGRQAEFSIIPVGSSYYLSLPNGERRPTPTPANPNPLCETIPIPEVEITINNNCDIIINEIKWPADGGIHDLQLTFSPNSGIRRSISTTPTTLYAFNNRNPPYSGHLTAGTYNVRLTGYYDANDGGALRQFPYRHPTLVNNYPANGIPTFTIHQSAGPSYHITYGVANTRIPAPTPANPTPVCSTAPCLTNCNENCTVGTSFTDWNHRQIDADSGQRNSVWYDTNRNTTIDIANETYSNYETGHIDDDTSYVNQTYTTLPSPEYIHVIPPANQPGQPIPGTSGITRASIITDLTNNGTSSKNDGFYYDFNATDKNKRDSAYTLYNTNYKPKTSVKWSPGSNDYGGTGSNTGWANTYDLTIKPESLGYGTANTSVSTNFSPASTTTKNSLVDFTTSTNQTQDNQQTASLLPYRWEFSWIIDADHKHKVNYNEWKRYVSKREYPYSSETGYWYQYKTTPTSSWRDHDFIGPTTTSSGWQNTPVSGSIADGVWITSLSIPTPTPPHSYSHISKLKNAHAVRWTNRTTIQPQIPINGLPIEWKYSINRSLTHTITRNTYLSGRLANCSYVLVVKPPECVVDRRLFDSSTEKRRNPAELGPNQNYEIFPPGGPTHFSRLRLINDNYFAINPTTQTEATLRPTLNSSSPWYPRDNSGTQVTALPAVGLSSSHTASANHPWPSGLGTTTDYHETNLTPLWPGEYRLNWRVGWSANPAGYPNHVSHYNDSYRTTANHQWAGPSPTNQTLTCTNPTDGIHVYVSAKPPICQVAYSIFEFTDPAIRLEIGLKNNNWVDLTVPAKTTTTQNAAPWPSTINAASVNLTPFGPPNYQLPQGWTARRPASATLTPGIPNPIAGDADGLAQALPGATYPSLLSTTTTDITSDNRLGTMPAPLGQYEYNWDLRARRGIEWWSSTGSGKLPGAWWDGSNSDERIAQTNNVNSLKTYDCRDLARVVQIPFAKTFIGGASAGGRFGLSADFSSCQNNQWITDDTTPQGAWGHSAFTTGLATAVGSSVDQALRAQGRVGGLYSSSLTDQPGSHTNAATVESKALTLANNTSSAFGGDWSHSTPTNAQWRCLPNYWQIPDNANANVAGLILTNPSNPAAGATTPNISPTGDSQLGPADGVTIQDGAVIYIDGNLEITGNMLAPGEVDLRATIYVNGNVTISGDITNNTDLAKKYFGLSDLGLLQIIARGNIDLRPTVTRVDATLVAYPIWDATTPSQPPTAGNIDLCASQTNDALLHYQLCASSAASASRQLRINGALVARRVYFNRLHESLQNRTTPAPAWPYGLEPPRATADTTRASELVVLLPEYHFVTPAASVYDQWIRRPQAIFDIPTSL